MIMLVIAMALLGCVPVQSHEICCSNEISVLVLKEASGEKVYTCSSYNLSMEYLNDATLSFDRLYFSSNVAVLSPLLSVSHVEIGRVSNKDGLKIYDFLEIAIRKDFVDLIQDGVMKLLLYYDWSNVIILSDRNEEFYLETGIALYKNLSLSIENVGYAQFDVVEQGSEALLKLLRSRRVVFLSMASERIKAIFDYAGDFVGSDYLWIVHSVDRSQLDLEAIEGVIEIQPKFISLQTATNYSNYFKLCKNVSSLAPVSVDILYWQNVMPIKLFNYSRSNGLTPINPAGVVYSGGTAQYSPLVFIALYYIGIFICFFAVTFVLLLYIHYRNEPAVKATSISLSLLVIAACYIWLYYLLVLNSTLLPSYHNLSSSRKDFMCIFRMWLHGLGYPVVLVMSVLTVKLFRIYRIFYRRGKINVYFSGNFALAMYALLLTSPNALICLVWSSSDPYKSHVTKSFRDGQLVINELCESQHMLKWLVGLLIHNILLALTLIVAAVMTRKIKQPDFKDTKKITAFSCWFLVTMVIGLSYWYILRVVGAHVVLVHAVLQLSHYSLIMQCLGFLFLPKLFPVIIRKWKKKMNVPVPKQ